MLVLAGRAAELVDSSALSPFTARALEVKRKEEQEAKIKAELDVLMSLPQADCSAQQWQRKLELYQAGIVLPWISETNRRNRKKRRRRKKKLPKTSSGFSSGPSSVAVSCPRFLQVVRTAGRCEIRGLGVSRWFRHESGADHWKVFILWSTLTEHAA